MEWYNILCLLGVPSISAAVVLGVYKVCKKALIKNTSDNLALKLGVQALLRSQLIDSYNHYKKKDFTPIYAKENFENMYRQYEALGENGVMQKIHDEFMDFPTG